MSRGTRCVLFGLAMTALAYVGPWHWPGWPAIALLDFVLARWAPSTVSPVLRASGTLVLLFVNAGFWALLAWLAWKLRDACYRAR